MSHFTVLFERTRDYVLKSKCLTVAFPSIKIPSIKFAFLLLFHYCAFLTFVQTFGWLCVMRYSMPPSLEGACLCISEIHRCHHFASNSKWQPQSGILFTPVDLAATCKSSILCFTYHIIRLIHSRCQSNHSHVYITVTLLLYFFS